MYLKVQFIRIKLCVSKAEEVLFLNGLKLAPLSIGLCSVLGKVLGLSDEVYITLKMLTVKMYFSY